MAAGVPFLVVVLQVVFFFVGSAPAGRGGEGSDLLEVGASGGGPGRCRDGWLLGGGGEAVLWPCSFIEFRFRRGAADGSCGLLLLVVAPSSRRLAVRQLRHRLKVWGEAVVDPIVVLPGGLGWFLLFSGSFLLFLFLFGPLCKVHKPS